MGQGWGRMGMEVPRGGTGQEWDKMVPVEPWGWDGVGWGRGVSIGWEQDSRVVGQGWGRRGTKVPWGGMGTLGQ